MRTFLFYLKDFFKTVHPVLLIFCVAYTALIIFLNFHYSIEPTLLSNITSPFLRFAGFYLVYCCAFLVPYLVFIFLKRDTIKHLIPLLSLIMIAPAIFALKVSFTGLRQLVEKLVGGDWGKYYGIIINLPSRLILLLILLLFTWWLGNYEKPFFGVTFKGFNWRPYLVMLLIMIPLISWASTQHDFLFTYPKMKQVYFILPHTGTPWLQKLFFELSYGMDFISIELFFRGFLVLAFVRYAGQDAILPMAVFYCSIHFGKPLAECISSFFGGLILGILVFRTKSITGGLMVHLGIAWMMEAGGYLGNV
jgi:hypothetical protein